MIDNNLYYDPAFPVFKFDMGVDDEIDSILLFGITPLLPIFVICSPKRIGFIQNPVVSIKFPVEKWEGVNGEGQMEFHETSDAA